MNATVREILSGVRIRDLELKRVPTLESQTPLGEVFRHLDEGRHRAVVICESERIVGILTERDILHRVFGSGLTAQTPVDEVMNPTPRTASPDDALSDAIESMVEGRFRNLPLVDEAGRECGLLTSREVLRFIAAHFPEAVLNLPPRLHQSLPRPEGG